MKERSIDKRIANMGERLGFGDELDRKRNGVMNIFRKVFGVKEKKTKDEIILDKMGKIRDDAEAWVKRDLYFEKAEKTRIEREKEESALATKGKNIAKVIGGLGKTVAEAGAAFKASHILVSSGLAMAGAGVAASGAGAAVGSFALAGGALYGGKKMASWVKEKWREHKYMQDELDYENKFIQERLKQRTSELMSIELMDKQDAGRVKEDKKYEGMRKQYITGKIDDNEWNEFLMNRAGESIKQWAEGKEGIDVKYTEREIKDMGVAAAVLGKTEEKLDGKVERKLFDIARSNPALFKKISNENTFKTMGKEYLNELKGLVLFQIPIVRLALTGAGGWELGNQVIDIAFEGNEWYEQNKYGLRTLTKSIAGIGGVAALFYVFSQEVDGSKIKGLVQEFRNDWGKVGKIIETLSPGKAEAAEIEYQTPQVKDSNVVKALNSKGKSIEDFHTEGKINIVKGDNLWKIAQEMQPPASNNIKTLLGAELAPKNIKGVAPNVALDAGKKIQIDAIKDFLVNKYKQQYPGANPDVIKPGQKIDFSPKELTEYLTKKGGVVEKVQNLTPKQAMEAAGGKYDVKPIKKAVAVEKVKNVKEVKSAEIKEKVKIEKKADAQQKTKEGQAQEVSKDSKIEDNSDINKRIADNDYVSQAEWEQAHTIASPQEYADYMEKVPLAKRVGKGMEKLKLPQDKIELEYVKKIEGIAEKFTTEQRKLGAVKELENRINRLDGNANKETIEDHILFLSQSGAERDVFNLKLNSAIELRSVLQKRLNVSPEAIGRLEAISSTKDGMVLTPEGILGHPKIYLSENYEITKVENAGYVYESSRDQLSSFRDWKKRILRQDNSVKWNQFLDYIVIKGNVSETNMRYVNSPEKVNFVIYLVEHNSFNNVEASSRLGDCLKLLDSRPSLNFLQKFNFARIILNPKNAEVSKDFITSFGFSEPKDIKIKVKGDRITIPGVELNGNKFNLHFDTKTGEFIDPWFFGLGDKRFKNPSEFLNYLGEHIKHKTGHFSYLKKRGRRG